MLVPARRLQVQQHHAGLDQLVARPVDLPDAAHGGAHEVGGVRGRSPQGQHDVLAVLRPGPVRAGVGDHQDHAGVSLLAPELLRRPAGEQGHGLDERRQLADRLAEGAGAGDLLLGRAQVIAGASKNVSKRVFPFQTVRLGCARFHRSQTGAAKICMIFYFFGHVDPLPRDHSHP